MGAKLPDRRFNTSLAILAARLAESSEASYSNAVGHDGRQAARRLFGHPDVTPDAILAGHYERTAARCNGHKMVLVAQDTTDLDYSGHTATPGLGPIDERREGRGLMAHSALVMTTDGLPLGLAHLDLWARDPADHGKKHRRKQRSVAEKESSKWGRALEAVEQVVPPDVEALVIQDREADVFAFIAQERRENTHLLIRACQPRCVDLPDWIQIPEGTPRKLLSVAAAAPMLGRVEVTIPRQTGQPARTATLTVRATPLTILPPASSRRSDGYLPQSFYVVQAREEDPPQGHKPICWVLICTRPVADLAQCLDLVRYYALRWMIERLHFVIKSGCRVERLQIDNVHRLRNAIALTYLVAWRLLHLTHLARTEPEAPAALALEADEITVLAAATERPVDTIADAVEALGILGGQERYRNAPPPGPKVLWLGIRRLQDLTEGWHLALRDAIGKCEPG